MVPCSELSSRSFLNNQDMGGPSPISTRITMRIYRFNTSLQSARDQPESGPSFKEPAALHLKLNSVNKFKFYEQSFA